jgi:hypothetical protein
MVVTATLGLPVACDGAERGWKEAGKFSPRERDWLAGRTGEGWAKQDCLVERMLAAETHVLKIQPRGSTPPALQSVRYGAFFG